MCDLESRSFCEFELLLLKLELARSIVQNKIIREIRSLIVSSNMYARGYECIWFMLTLRFEILCSCCCVMVNCLCACVVFRSQFLIELPCYRLRNSLHMLLLSMTLALTQKVNILEVVPMMDQLL